jgi:hypothetical protein
VDGILDWYWLGVVAGLGVAAGVTGRPPRGAAGLALRAGAVLVSVAAIALVVWTLPRWALAAIAVGALVGWLSLRRLSPEALSAAFIALTVLAFVPAFGYLAAVAAPLLGRRLVRREAERYAGLRILAKD